ncbi:hypothetical protein GBAR_LOCUS2000, partial [Geodia barretti]
MEKLQTDLSTQNQQRPALPRRQRPPSSCGRFRDRNQQPQMRQDRGPIVC